MPKFLILLIALSLALNSCDKNPVKPTEEKGLAIKYEVLTQDPIGLHFVDFMEPGKTVCTEETFIKPYWIKEFRTESRFELILMAAAINPTKYFTTCRIYVNSQLKEENQGYAYAVARYNLDGFAKSLPIDSLLDRNSQALKTLKNY